LKLKDFQDLGHQIVLIIGNTTGFIGDTSDKESERPLLSQKKVNENAKTYIAQAGKVLDISKVEVRRNSEWLLKLNYNDIGGHADQFSVADFIARDNIKRRLDAGKRVSLREMLYPLLQGYDSVAVKADVELGGTDQRFNLLAGRALQVRASQPPQDVLMTNLILGVDGKKMSSSWGNTINLTDTPEDMYGKVMRVPDELIESYFIHCTRVPLERVRELVGGMKKEAINPKDVKMELARDITARYHGGMLAQKAENHFVTVFQKGGTPEVAPVTIPSGTPLREIATAEGIVSSGNEFTRLILNGAVMHIESGRTITEPQMRVEESGTYKIGKRRFIRVKVIT
jgi:tyrosyl-tRNA synthetase